MITLANMYHPVTAAPFRCSDAYCELPPCTALRPYIRCFWGTTSPLPETRVPHPLVIPDTCMDIVFHISYTGNRYDGGFCTVDEHAYLTAEKTSPELNSVFGIRFYAWAAVLFSEQELSAASWFSLEDFSSGLKADLEPILFDVPDLCGKIEHAQRFLMHRLKENRINSTFLNSVYHMLHSCGRARISEVCEYSCVSERQLERLFLRSTGVSPKTFSSLVRYQLLWQDMILSPSFSVLDAVEKYGYTDQAHLLNDFRRRHLMSPGEAVSYAMSDFYNTSAT